MEGFSKVIEMSEKEMTKEEILKECGDMQEEFFQKRREFEKAIDTFEKSMDDCRRVFGELVRQAEKSGDTELCHNTMYYYCASAFTNQASAMRRMIDLRV